MSQGSDNEPQDMQTHNSSAWSGGFYGLAMEFKDNAADTLTISVRRLWSHPSLRLDSIADSAEQLPDKLRGIAILPEYKQILCASMITRFEHGNHWLEFFSPLSSIATHYLVGGFPFERGEPDSQWRKELDQWFVQIATYIFEKVQFDLALIGFEIDPATTSIKKIRRHGIPTKRFEGLLLPEGRDIGWYPPNEPIS